MIITRRKYEKLKSEKENAEQRATDYYRIVQVIENNIINAEKEKTPAVIVVDKIKEVIRPQN